MTSPDDYADEMSASGRIDDAAAERILGGDVDGELAPLAVVVRTLRAAAARPVPPTSTLAERMASGVFPGPGERYEATRYRAPAHRPQGRGFGAAASSARSFLRALAAAPVNVTARGLAIRATLAGVAIAVIGAGSAGFAGVLPEPAQVRFESVVESVTPYKFRGRSDGPGGPVEPDPTRQEGRTGPGRDKTESAPPSDSSVPGSRPTELPGQGEQHRPQAPSGQVASEPPGPPANPGPPEGVPGPPEGVPGPPEGVPGPPVNPGPPEWVPGPGGPDT